MSQTMYPEEAVNRAIAQARAEGYRAGIEGAARERQVRDVKAAVERLTACLESARWAFEPADLRLVLSRLQALERESAEAFDLLMGLLMAGELSPLRSKVREHCEKYSTPSRAATDATEEA